MKKNIIYNTVIILAAMFVGGTLTSCDSFLDRQEDENLTFDKIWEQVSTTQRYFYQCMGYLPDDSWGIFENSQTSHTIGASDESSMTWSWSYQNLTFGSWNPTNLPNDNFNRYYEAIRDCNIFMSRVLTCSDPQAVQADLYLWYNCVRWARAYYYFLLMRDFGPVFLLGDETIDPNASLASLARRRNTWDECVQYVVDEMTACTKVLEATYDTGHYGLPTRGAALAVISRLKLYSARPLFNGGNNIYRGTGTNDKGEPLFPKFNPNKWVEAAQAALDVIECDGGYSLCTIGNNAYQRYMNIMIELWNSEIIFSSGGYRSRQWYAWHTSPAGLTTGIAYGGWGPTQQQVDAYAMENGIYPITGYERDGSPVIDTRAHYPSDEFALSMYSNPFLANTGAGVTQSQTPAMYQNREPRFYVSVYWCGGQWRHGSESHIASFALNSNAHSSHDYPKSGYLVNRYYDHTQNSYIGYFGNITFPTFRLGEIYLNYIEAVLECERQGLMGEGVDHARAMNLWNELRARSGMAPITNIYPEAANDTNMLLELLRRERRIELAFEGHRYYDTRTWLIATETDNGPMYGMNTFAVGSGDTVPAEFWQRTVFETRKFEPKHYLFPFPQRELDRNRLIDQNYGW